MSALAAIALCIAAFTALALTMERHEVIFAHAFGARSWRPCLRWAGAALLTAALGLAVQAEGWSVGLVLWCAALMPAGLGVSAVLAWRPTAVLPLGGAALVAGLLAWMLDLRQK